MHQPCAPKIMTFTAKHDLDSKLVIFKSWFDVNQLLEWIATKFCSLFCFQTEILICLLASKPVCSDLRCTVHPAKSHCTITIHCATAVKFLDRHSKQRGKDKDVITSDALHCLSVIATTALWYTCHVKPRHPCGWCLHAKCLVSASPWKYLHENLIS